MINQIIEDINHALEHDSLISALALALTLPDICGKAEWPEKKNGKRYIEWFDKYAGKSERCTCEVCQEAQMPYLSGEVVYQLRNSVLHQGTLDIDTGKVKAEDNQIDEFILVKESRKEFDMYMDSSSVLETYGSDGTKEMKKRLHVNIRRLCNILTVCAKGYYENNKVRFKFMHFSVIDWDKELEKMNYLHLPQQS